MSEMRVCPNCLAPLGEESVCARCGFDSASYTVLPHHLVPGSLVKQRYQVGRVLGEGGFGITYVGRDTVLNLKVAIKEFYMAGYVNRNHDASDTVFATLGTHRDTFTKNKEKFLSEARVLARILEQMDHDGFDGSLPVQIAHCDNAAAAGMLEHGIHAKWPQARVLIHPCGGLCSFYAQDQGIILTY